MARPRDDRSKRPGSLLRNARRISAASSSMAGRAPPRRAAIPTKRSASREGRWRQSGSSRARSLSRLTADLVRERVRGTILERIGDTPLIPLHRVGAGLRGDLWVKVESANPGGSVKDRPALSVELDAEEVGRLGPRRADLHGTTGNAGVALATAFAVRGPAGEL